MNNKIIVTLVCMLVVFSGFIFPVSSISNKIDENNCFVKKDETVSTSGVDYWAVIVGIADYKGMGIFFGNDLPVSDYHMKKLYNVLISDQKYPESHVRLLLNEDAKRSNILSALDWLSSVSDSNDVVVFSYQGHGNVIEDTNGDESDGMDEGIIAWEGLDGFITDDELDSKFDKISCKGMYLIFNSCFSGGLVDSNLNVGLNNKGFYNYKKSFSSDIDDNKRVIIMSSMDRGLALAYPSMTKTIANGLTGLADRNFDKSITAEELSIYAKNHVLLKFLSIIILFPPSIISFIISALIARILHGYFPLPIPTIYDGYSGDLKIK